MDKVYNHQETESEIYDFWEKGGYFVPKIDKTKKPFVITLPPPNVTGSLHAGHAMYVIEDIMVRYHRMKQEPTLWLPGFDHASIAVEYLVTKQLAKEGLNKKEVGREEFLKRAHEFAAKSRDYIREQLKKLGFSLDWSREAYTMDETRSEAVKEAFKRLSDQGLIYKGKRIINWCTQCQTALSDLENEYQEENGKLYFVKYGPITIATTRPETMFADVAVAVNPQSSKYKHLVGQLVPLPLTDRKIPVIEDELVDPQFGTGALKITPGHDELDFEIGKKHKLKTLTAIDQYGKLTSLAGPYAGLKASEAREKIVADLKKGGFIEKITDFTHSVGHCERCNTVTEPLLSEQWFVKTQPLAKMAIKVVEEGKIKIVPKYFEKVYFHWLKNIEDWCISR
ncbi:MAG: class I tRNA ligase family protein, partial [Microgenomates group bacterium]